MTTTPTTVDLRRLIGLALAAATLLFLTTAVADEIPGTVQAASPTTLKVDGTTYTIEPDTTLQDQSGSRLSPKELTPGTRVELEVDDAHRLINVRASVIR